MNNGLSRIKDWYIKDDKKIFYLICALFAIIISFVRKYADDVASMRVECGTIADYWQKAVDMYSTWTHRVLVNFVVFLFTDNKFTLIWGIFMGISLYVLMYSFSRMFTTHENSNKCTTVIACLVMLFPFHYLNSAGWITTMTIYLSPIAFGFFALLPLRKINDKEKIKWYEYIVFSFALIYGANIEQMMVVILGSYLVGFVYLLCCGKFHFYIIVQLFLSIASFLVTMLCPGNYVRKEDEVLSWYKNWGMLDRIDKIDLGYSTTMQNIFWGSNIFIIVICLLFTYIIGKKYKNKNYMLISATPTVLVIMFGPFKSIVISMYPYIGKLTDNLEKNGLVTVANRGDFRALGRYVIWAALISMVCVSIILLQDSIKSLVVSFVLLGAGTASRLAIGFSPTIYASRERTFAVMYFCIIATACYVYANSISNGYIEPKAAKRFDSCAILMIICSMIHIWFTVSMNTALG